MNIKFRGARFRNTNGMVGLEPEDCLALVTHKIHHGLLKQKEEIPRFFILGSAPDAASDIGRQVPRRFVDLATLTHAFETITGKRHHDELSVEHLVTGGYATLAPAVQRLRDQLVTATWRLLSARQAAKPLMDKLFERVVAVRVRAVNRSYRNTELDILSIGHGTTPLQRFLAIIRERELHGVAAGLERGTA
jgi:hypothetical protein